MTGYRRGWRTVNPSGTRRVVVTKELPGDRWLLMLVAAGCRVAIASGEDILSADEIGSALSEGVDAVIGQLTEDWSGPALKRLAASGASLYSQFAVGHDNVDVSAATRLGLPVGNTPGVLTETTAELAVALTTAAARRVVEGDRMMRRGTFHGWLPTMLLGRRFCGGTVAVVGAGRIGASYARMMVEGFGMDMLYYDLQRNETLEERLSAYSDLRVLHGESALRCTRVETLEALLTQADVVSLHPALTSVTRHMIGASELALMREDAILVNASRGPLIEEQALVAHCREHPRFTAALDVYEDEPRTAPGLTDLDNVVLVPHLGSATTWTREGMATLAAANVVAVLNGWPVWRPIRSAEDVRPFLEDPDPPQASPSIVNADELGLEHFGGAEVKEGAL